VVVGLLEMELHLPGATSIKDKRQVIKSITGQITSRFKVSVSEVEFQDLWQRSLLAVSMVSAEGGQVQKVLNHILRWTEGVNGAELIRSEIHMFSPEDRA